MSVVFTTKSEKRQQSINIREAFNLWDVLNSKYLAVERLQTWKNLAHDADLVMILKRSLKSLKDNIAILEDMMIKFSVKSRSKQEF